MRIRITAGASVGGAVLSLLILAGPGCHRQADEAVSQVARCEAGDAAACFREGTAWFKGIGRPQDLDRAESFWVKACRGGAARACMDAGILNGGHAHLEGVAHRHPNFEAAARWYGAACDLGEPSGCFGLSLLVADGKGVDADPSRARTLMKRACTLGQEPACARLTGGESDALR